MSEQEKTDQSRSDQSGRSTADLRVHHRGGSIQPRDECAWLIERHSPRPIWWSGFGRDAWTFNADGAVRFQRRVDAERVIEGFSLDAFVSEHLWMTKGAAR